MTIGRAQRRPERAPESTATESARRPAWAVRWSRWKRSARTSSSLWRSCMARRSASIPVERACMRPAALANEASAASRSASARRRSSVRRVFSPVRRTRSWSPRATSSPSEPSRSRSASATCTYRATVTAATQSSRAPAAVHHASGVRTDGGAERTKAVPSTPVTSTETSRARTAGRSGNRSVPERVRGVVAVINRVLMDAWRRRPGTWSAPGADANRLYGCGA